MMRTRAQPDIAVCPVCGAPAGERSACPGCGENLDGYEKLPLRSEWGQPEEDDGFFVPTGARWLLWPQLSFWLAVWRGGRRLLSRGRERRSHAPE